MYADAHGRPLNGLTHIFVDRAQFPLIKVDLSSMTKVSEYVSPASSAYSAIQPNQMFVTNDHVYFLAYDLVTNDHVLKKLQSSDMALSGQLPFGGSSIFTDGQGYAYIGSGSRQIAKVRLEDMTLLGIVETGTGVSDDLHISFGVGSLGYFGPSSNTKQVLKYYLNAGKDELPAVTISGLTLNNTVNRTGTFHRLILAGLTQLCCQWPKMLTAGPLRRSLRACSTKMGPVPLASGTVCPSEW